MIYSVLILFIYGQFWAIPTSLMLYQYRMLALHFLFSCQVVAAVTVKQMITELSQSLVILRVIFLLSMRNKFRTKFKYIGMILHSKQPCQKVYLLLIFRWTWRHLFAPRNIIFAARLWCAFVVNTSQSRLVLRVSFICLTWMSCNVCVVNLDFSAFFTCNLCVTNYFQHNLCPCHWFWLC